MIELFSASRDEVIKSAVAQGVTTYAYALEQLYPLINKFDEQRKIQRKKFYERLRLDIVRGCIMPAITLAFISKDFASETKIENLSKFVHDNISQGYVLDGMQRLNTLNEASSDKDFNGQRPLHLTVIVAERYDLLLYRMITLNNGQKPMTARHQIEMLTKGMLDTENLNIEIVTEKETETSKPQGVFRRSDISEAYTAFLTNNVHNQNARIIEAKLDEILVGKVMESNLTDSDVSFHDVLGLVEKFSVDPAARDWLRVGNNLIGFSVGAKRSFMYLNSMDADQFSGAVKIFEGAFEAMDVSKINVGKYRRDLSRVFIERMDDLSAADVDDLVNVFLVETLVD